MKPTPKYASKPTSDDPRDVEAWALAEAARRLLDAGRNPENPEALRSALTLNQRLWTIFQAAMTEDDCPHPPDVRTNIAALSLLVDRETMKRLGDLDGTKLDTLVSINRAVASGLMTRDGAAMAEANAQAQASVQAQAAGMPAPVSPGMPARPAVAPPAAAPDNMPREPLRISI